MNTRIFQRSINFIFKQNIGPCPNQRHAEPLPHLNSSKVANVFVSIIKRLIIVLGLCSKKMRNGLKRMKKQFPDF